MRPDPILTLRRILQEIEVAGAANRNPEAMSEKLSFVAELKRENFVHRLHNGDPRFEKIVASLAPKTQNNDVHTFDWQGQPLTGSG